MGGTPKWTAYKFTKVIMENPIEMDDLVAPTFMETPKPQTWIIPWIIGITDWCMTLKYCLLLWASYRLKMSLTDSATFA
jgi:hypothetical protein